MDFSDLEKIIKSRGLNTLAEFARELNTTPQAVSNWKSRNQVPHHIVVKLREQEIKYDLRHGKDSFLNFSKFKDSNFLNSQFFDKSFTIPDIFLVLAKQLKIILIATFVSVFLTFNYLQFILPLKYMSVATILLPENKNSNMDGLMSLASRFGMSIPSTNRADLSSPSLFPELLKSRVFAEKILEKRFFTNKYNEELTLLEILSSGTLSSQPKETIISDCISEFNKLVEFNIDSKTSISTLKVSAFEPAFAKNLAESILIELENLNKSYKNKNVTEKIVFINERINSVEKDLKLYEEKLKIFNEQNRQISSPSLTLEQQRLESNVEVQRSIFLTLKQQLELSKIEEIQEASVIQIIDKPQEPTGPYNRNIKIGVLTSLFFGITIGIMLGFYRNYLSNLDFVEKKKVKKIRYFFRTKINEIFYDKRVTGIVSLLMLMGFPFYIGYESKVPIYFDRYSSKLMLIIVIYSSIMFLSTILFLVQFFKTKKK